MPSYSASGSDSITSSGKRFATIWRIRGEVLASGGSGKERILHSGDTVYVGEHLRAAALAEATMKTDDAGVVAIRPNTEFTAERFAAEGKPTDSFTMRLITGSLRVISGWIAHTNRSGHTIVTPTATIGIRGTDHEPYVLSAELAKSTSNPQGVYDKVNRGGTTMKVGANTLDIDAGRAGFVRAPVKTRALMTILLPVLLDKVPNFYVPGQFDAELDRFSQTADSESLLQLQQMQKAPGATPEKPAPERDNLHQQEQLDKAHTATPDSQTPDKDSQKQSGQILNSSSAACSPARIAKSWIGQLDAAVARHDAQAIIAMFAPQAEIRATVRNSDGEMVSIDLGREELAQSTITALKGLKHYKQRRVSINANLASPASDTICDRISIKSVVIEQGRQSGKPYRFESMEEYVIELQAGKWIAVKAETTQQ